MEAVQTRVQKAVTDMINQLDKEHIRKMQADMYKCSAKCCENTNYKMEDVQNCIERCSAPINASQSFIQSELGNYQNRLQRCAMDCQDKIRDKVGKDTPESEMVKYKGEMETCVSKCADVHIKLIPNMMKKMKEVLKQHSTAH